MIVGDKYAQAAGQSKKNHSFILQEFCLQVWLAFWFCVWYHQVSRIWLRLTPKTSQLRNYSVTPSQRIGLKNNQRTGLKNKWWTENCMITGMKIGSFLYWEKKIFVVTHRCFMSISTIDEASFFKALFLFSSFSYLRAWYWLMNSCCF